MKAYQKVLKNFKKEQLKEKQKENSIRELKDDEDVEWEAEE